MESLPPTPVPVSPPSRRRRGFTLVLTLIVLSAITLLVLGLFANVSSESATANNYDHAFRAQTAVRSGLARVEALLQRGTWSDDYLVLEHLQNPPPSNTTPTDEQWRNRQPVLTLARAKITGDTTLPNGYTATWEYTPLTSGVQPPPPTSGTPSLPTTPLVAREDAQTKKPLEVATALPKRLPWQTSQNTFWEVIYEDRDEDNNPATPSVRVPVARYAFHVEDLQGLLSLDHAGNPGDAVENATGMLSRNHEREKFEVFESLTDARLTSPRLWYAGLAPGLRTPDDDPLTDDRRWVMSQSALYSLLEPTATSDTTQIDNQLMVARHVVKAGSPTQVTSLLMGPDAWKPILMKEDITNAWPTLLQRNNATDAGNDRGRLPAGPGRRLEENTITGLRPYHEMPLIPVEPGVFANPREPKMNLNRVLVEHQSVSNTLPSGVEEIVNHIEKHLPTPVAPLSNNLLGFSQRSGSYFMSSSAIGSQTPNSCRNYLRSLAAGMLDYADLDCLPILQEGQYRGQENTPLISEHILMHRWEKTTTEEGRKYVYYSETFYYELWNMSNRPITGQFEAEYVNRSTLQCGAFNYNLQDQDSLAKIVENAPYGAGERDVYWMPLYMPNPNGIDADQFDIQNVKQGRADPTRSVVTIKPNEYVVLASMPITFRLDAGPASVFIEEISTNDNVQSHLRVRFRPNAYHQNPETKISKNTQTIVPEDFFVVIDRTGQNVERNRRALDLQSSYERQRYCCNPINFSTGESSITSSLQNNNGDPRASFFILGKDGIQTLAKYASEPNSSGAGGASPWGRNRREGVGNGVIYKEIFPSKWGDKGHDGPAGIYPANNQINPHAPSILSQIPQYTEAQRNAAPMQISNAGRFFSATELGHIYDPIFWDPNGSAQNQLNVPQGWQMFWDVNIAATANPYFSGGHTLRIGRPEHSKFRSNHTGGLQSNRRLSASTLLDLFHCGIPQVGNIEDASQGEQNKRDLTGPLIEIRGQVNINTASRDVLRAIVSERFVTDPGIRPALTGSPTTSLRPPQNASEQANVLVDAIIRNRPYITVAQAAERIRLDTAVDFQILGVEGKQAGWSSTTSEWNDSAAEETFARLYNSTTPRSRHFRVSVTGQAVRAKRSDPTKLEPLSTRSRVFHVFVKPIRNSQTGLIEDQQVEIIHEQDL